jgi:hypothetical protein
MNYEGYLPGKNSTTFLFFSLFTEIPEILSLNCRTAEHCCPVKI